jgi:hypothetical protein
MSEDLIMVIAILKQVIIELAVLNPGIYSTAQGMINDLEFILYKNIRDT